MAAIANFSLYAGEDAQLPDTVFQADGVTPQDITGWNVQFDLGLPGGPSLVTKTVQGGGIQLTTPTAGVLTVLLLAADTASLAPGNYSFRIRRTDAGAVADLTVGTCYLLGR